MFALVFVCAFAAARPAAAGPVEQMIQVAIHASDPNTMIVRYTWGGDGMLRTTDGGKTWSLICDSLLFQTSSTHSGTVAIPGDGTTYMAVFSGLWHDDKHGCSWKSESQYDGQWIGDLALDPTDPNVLYAVTSTASTMTKTVLNGVLKRDAMGTWSDLGTKADMLATRLHAVTANGKLRFYVGAIKGQVMPPDGGTLSPNYVTRVSDDMGQTWKENVYGTVDGTLRIQGVDPTNPDRIIASVNRASDDPLGGDDLILVSNDQGAHFTQYLTIAEIGGVAFAPDGRVWIGDTGDTTDPLNKPGGLYFANSLDSSPQKLSMGTYPVQCLAYEKANSTLYACQHFWFGSVKLDDGSFNSLIKFTDVQSMISCPGVDVTGQCMTQLCNAWCGYSHFAAAPMCSVYNTPTCGIPVQIQEDAGTGTSGSAGTGAVGGSAGSPVVMSTAGTSATGSAGTSVAHDAGVVAIDAGQPAPKKKSGCSAIGTDPAAIGELAWLLGLPLWLRRRARLRA